MVNWIKSIWKGLGKNQKIKLTPDLRIEALFFIYLWFDSQLECPQQEEGESSWEVDEGDVVALRLKYKADQKGTDHWHVLVTTTIRHWLEFNAKVR